MSGRLLMILALLGLIAHAELAPQRKVTGNVLDALGSPASRIEVDSAIPYVGLQRFILYDVADAEQHLFAEADKEMRITRFYWLQFEGYLPNNPRASYNYKSPKSVDIGGLSFVVDANPRKYGGPMRAGSDGARMVKMLESKGFHFPAAAALVRMVHVPDAAKRSELMIIYAEDLAPSGVHVEELAEGGKHSSRWPAMSDALLKAAINGLKIMKRSRRP